MGWWVAQPGGGGGGLPPPLTFVNNVLRIDDDSPVGAYATGPAAGSGAAAVASEGQLRLPDTFSLRCRNNADTGDLVLVSMNGGVSNGLDHLAWGYNPLNPPNNHPVGMTFNVTAGYSFIFYSGTRDAGRFQDQGGAGYALPTNASLVTPTVRADNFFVCGDGIARSDTFGFVTEWNYRDVSTTGLITLKKRDKVAGHVATTDATPATVLSYLLEFTDTVVSFSCIVTATIDPAGNKGGYFVRGLVHRGSGGAALVGTPIVEAFEQDAAWDCVAAVSGNYLLIQVTGIAATIITWICSGDLQILIV